ncbi:MAG: twin-arginine translocase subunit TatC [Thermoleophilia bacterium]
MPVKPEETFTILEHLDELRKRVFWSIVVVTTGIIVAAIFNDQVFNLLLHPLRQVPNLQADSYQIITLSPVEPFMVSLKVWVIASLIATSPFLIYQLWAFVGPAFTSTEKRYFYPVVIATAALFLIGVAFGYLIVLPKGLTFLLSFGGTTFNVQNRANEYFTFVALFILAFGAIFEMPVILVLLAKVGVIDDKFLRRHRRYAIVINALAAALLTPGQDVFSMILMLIPLLILYEVSIPLARLVQPKGTGSVGAKDDAKPAGAT